MELIFVQLCYHHIACMVLTIVSFATLLAFTHDDETILLLDGGEATVPLSFDLFAVSIVLLTQFLIVFVHQ